MCPAALRGEPLSRRRRPVATACSERTERCMLWDECSERVRADGELGRQRAGSHGESFDTICRPCRRRSPRPAQRRGSGATLRESTRPVQAGTAERAGAVVCAAAAESLREALGCRARRSAGRLRRRARSRKPRKSLLPRQKVVEHRSAGCASDASSSRHRACSRLPGRSASSSAGHSRSGAELVGVQSRCSGRVLGSRVRPEDRPL